MIREKIEAIIKREQAREARTIGIAEMVRAALLPYDGKPITRRLASVVQKAAGDAWRVDYGVSGGGPFADAWIEVNEPDNFAQRVRLVLGQPSHAFALGSLTFRQNGEHDYRNDIIGFDTLNAHYLHWAKERNAQRAAVLMDGERLDRIALAVEDYNAAREVLNDEIGRWGGPVRDFPDDFAVSALLDGDEGRRAREVYK